MTTGFTKGLETKEKILHGALEMARHGGLDSLTIGEVASKVSMSKSGVFTHFASREELLLSLLEFSNSEFKRKVFERALLAKAGLPRIKTMSDLWIAWDDEAAGGCPFLSASFEFDDRHGPVRDAVVRTQKQATGIWQKAAEVAVRAKDFKADTDCAQFAYEMFGNILSYNLYKRLLKDGQAGPRYKRTLDSILNRYTR